MARFKTHGEIGTDTDPLRPVLNNLLVGKLFFWKKTREVN
jgi:hypothetical protein